MKKINNKKFKALIIDVDGTLIENKPDAIPSKEIAEAIKKAAEFVHVGIATQRPLFYARPIFKHLKLSGPSIIAGGAQVIDSETLEILREELMNTEDLNKIIKIVKEFKKKHDLRFMIQDTGGEDKEFTDDYTPNKLIEVAMFSLESEVADELKTRLSKLTTLSVHKVVSWEMGRFGVVVTHALATKQHGILEVARILNIDTREIIGVGDGDNDLPLLMACGLKVAMGNAVENLKEIADYVAPPVEEHGLADVINKFIL